ncbi:UDP-N-acetylmuramoyl-L-alanine--D-glutamate ligase [Candidatus Peregrinibacteria bacterium]|nr:UDP-N-acetylmuramoyl-L-alanine--D-glutamate ligase [Candidatus Peregrinibacteria bacterium]
MKIAIIGFGTEGRALLHYFCGKGHELTVFDLKRKEIQAEFKGKAKFHFGPDYLDNLQGFDLVFRSPGVPYLTKQFDPVRQKLTGLTRYFLEKCPCEIIGVTGTKGKGTTATLICEILKKDKGRRVFIGGNIGQPPIAFLDQLKKDDLVVLELSSFQLQDATVSPHIAVVLGISPDHMDHHANMAEYVEAKKNLVKFQKKSDFAVIDVDNEYGEDFAAATAAKVNRVLIKKAVNEGGFIRVGRLVVKRGKTGTIVGTKGETGLIGEHNLKNMLAAAVAANLAGADVLAITDVIKEFRGLPHRLEFVKEFAGAKFYNDSASTNPQTTIAAVRAFDGPIILIVGGADKNTDFSPLGHELAHNLNVRTVVVMGQTKPKIEKAVEEAIIKNGGRNPALELITAESYQEAFMVARMLAREGDTVLLSPACASFDMFSNYQERGDIFRDFVMDLA